MNGRVLVVEDNLASRELLVELLGSLPCEVKTAGDGAAALEAVRSFRPDLVLMDIQLPLLDGTAVLRAIRGDPGLRNIRVIAVTAYAMQGDREKFLREGFDGYLCKPIDVAVLLTEVRKVLDAA